MSAADCQGASRTAGSDQHRVAPELPAVTDKLYSQAEMDQQVAAATQMKEMQMRSLENQKAGTMNTVKNVVNKPAPKIGISRTANYAVDTHSLRKPLTRQERRHV